MDLHYILLRDDEGQSRRKEAETIVARLREGRFDSIARTKSARLARNGRHFGPVLVRDLDTRAHATARTAKAGDVLGPYSGPFGHEIYQAGNSRSSRPTRCGGSCGSSANWAMIPDYQARLRERYRFELDTTMVRPLFFALATQTPDSILASLSPTARAPSAASSARRARPRRRRFPHVPGSPARTRPAPGDDGRLRIRDAQALRELATGHSFAGFSCVTPRTGDSRTIRW